MIHNFQLFVHPIASTASWGAYWDWMVCRSPRSFSYNSGCLFENPLLFHREYGMKIFFPFSLLNPTDPSDNPVILLQVFSFSQWDGAQDHEVSEFQETSFSWALILCFKAEYDQWDNGECIQLCQGGKHDREWLLQFHIKAPIRVLFAESKVSIS